jgi:hypothetical protein
MWSIYVLEACEEEHPDDDNVDSETEISLHTLFGACTAETMRSPVSMQDHTIVTLVNSNSTHCFMVDHVARHLNLTPMTKDGMTMGVGNSQILSYLGIYYVVSFSIHGELFYIDFFNITLEGYELVLGCNWLCTLEPIMWTFTHHYI